MLTSVSKHSQFIFPRNASTAKFYWKKQHFETAHPSSEIINFLLFLPFPPLGNDIEALQIHLCFCRSSNLRFVEEKRRDLGAHLVSSVINNYLSQQKETARSFQQQSYQLASAHRHRRFKENLWWTGCLPSLCSIHTANRLPLQRGSEVTRRYCPTGEPI